jgi:molybdenum cofactor synthesis domain-containing protein
MKKIDTKQAVGHVLCHDITQIIKGVKKDAIFRKGHIVTQEDIPVLLSLGKDHLFVWEKQEGMLHENEAADILCGICINENMRPSPVKEGKIDIFADTDGLFSADVEKLFAINSLGEMMIATRHTNFPVKKGDKLAGTRVIPLVIEKEKMDRAVRTAGDKPLLSILPFRHKEAAVIITGNEVYYGRIQDAFGPVIRQKLDEYGADVIYETVLDDDMQKISDAIGEAVSRGAEMVICTGGMSVDPDDTTPSAIKNTGAEIVTYGVPVLPGAMFLLAYYRKEGKPVAIMGLPGCVMYSKRSIFDLVLPRVMADQVLTMNDLAKLGHGGLCLQCDTCVYPNCGFGK